MLVFGWVRQFCPARTIFIGLRHAGAKPDGVSTPSGCCNPKACDHPLAACRRKSGAAGPAECPPCPESLSSRPQSCLTALHRA